MKPTTPRNGPRKFFWAAALTATLAAPSRADSPFYADDPNFSPGWEIKLGFTGEHNTGGTTIAEVLDLNYAIVPSVRLDLTLSTKNIWPAGARHEFGFGDTEFKIKWRIQDEDEKGTRIAWGTAPKILVPTAGAGRGLGDGVVRFQLPVQFGKTVGKWYHFGEAGYQWAFDSSATDVAYGGAGTLYNFTEHLALGTELYSFIPTKQTGDWQLLTTLASFIPSTPTGSSRPQSAETCVLRATAGRIRPGCFMWCGTSETMEPWKLYAFAAASFAGLTSVIAKADLKVLGADLGLAVRTVFVFSFIMLNTRL